jgi:antitoxin VapB
MSLNIKDAEAHRLARAISEATGETMTHVVTQALRERLAQLERRKAMAGREELNVIAKRVAGQVKGPYLAHDAWLYDDSGLPK